MSGAPNTPPAPDARGVAKLETPQPGDDLVERARTEAGILRRIVGASAVSRAQQGHLATLLDLMADALAARAVGAGAGVCAAMQCDGWRHANALSGDLTAFYRRLEKALGIEDCESDYAPDVWAELARRLATPPSPRAGAVGTCESCAEPCAPQEQGRPELCWGCGEKRWDKLLRAIGDATGDRPADFYDPAENDKDTLRVNLVALLQDAADVLHFERAARGVLLKERGGVLVALYVKGFGPQERAEQANAPTLGDRVSRMADALRDEITSLKGDIAVLHYDRRATDEVLATAVREVERLQALLNTPELVDFPKAVLLEAAHQRERWGSAHDAGKGPEDWFWLVGYLAGKALRAHVTGDREKALHHTISTAAALCNWHAAVLGASTEMRPGIGPDHPAHPEHDAVTAGASA